MGRLALAPVRHVTNRSLAVVLIAVLGIGVAAIIWTGRRLIQPVPQRVGPPPRELNMEAVALRSESGATLHGWLSPARKRGAVLLLPPVRANRLAMLPRARFLAEAGYSTLLVDLQATGESEGEAITFGWRERLDVLAAVQFLRQRRASEPVAIIGWSLGGAAALLATPPLQIEGMVLEAVYPSIDRAVENRLRMRMGALGSLMAPFLLWQLTPRLGVSPGELRPVDHISRINVPVLIIGGSEDRHTTEADTRLLYEHARDPKEIWLVPGAAHVDYYEAAGDEYRRRVLRFLAMVFDVDPVRCCVEESGR